MAWREGDGGGKEVRHKEGEELQEKGVQGVVMDKVRLNICWEVFEKSSMEKETRLVSGW